MTRALARLLTLAGLAAATPAVAQDVVESPVTLATPVVVPWGVGEKLEYDVSFGKVHVGSGTIAVLPMDTVRGHDTWHTSFRLSGGFLLYKVRDLYEDWSDVNTLASLRYRQDIDEGNYEPKRKFEIYPDRQEYLEVSKKDAQPMQSVARPLNDVSFIFFLRTLPLRVGLDTTFHDYFKADRSQVNIKVVRRDTVKVGAGRFAALVIQPRFESKLFSDGGKAEIWVSDDENRIILQMKSKVSFGSLNLYLKSYQPSPSTNIPLARIP